MGPIPPAPPKRPFETVVQEHGATVLRVCRAIVGIHDGEDAWSETFLSALKAYGDLPADANTEAWLVTIAHRKCIDILRASVRRPVPVQQTPDVPSSLGVPDEGQVELLDAVGQLPPKQRQAIAYHYLVGLPYKDVAALVGVTPDAARRAAADGVKALRAALGRPSPTVLLPTALRGVPG
ncbi:RNA polymerase sigma factor [Paenarthrobacter ureafaciens]|uniref:RNA polymerase sigma factor n=1 Tax=Paenarthrobacter ureafaciens TaxID=37931 RepID=A0AAX3EKR7_PAEUR|nr:MULTISPECIES: RNA polymerase sigma factor [Paenarthrobacter]AMB38812.1 RNA polymerase subunit sigma [Arthrobacter sp. ATCC 21022]NKR11573.1 RNA polymerase subunit sigma [Arthrobacter sp. M5]NKR16334.1 RNA polymerase subunit sigma [Arthrobacter sp. M6]OEH57566.1 RNA polymerase subunit sigma [Arthrobacter sp. D4]OEH58841.1 RNA polymerase subunit sigma [Arthrobacter sp. D2]BCW82347.1 RNA polymerase sigma24 factor [Arthrobacter sp. NicSoilE8]